MLTEAQAKKIAIKETQYCYILSQAWEGNYQDSICLERIFTKDCSKEEIRLAWWANNKQALRPADIDAIDWVDLFSRAVKNNVFNDTEKLGMIKTLLK